MMATRPTFMTVVKPFPSAFLDEGRGLENQIAVKDEGEQSNVHFIVKVPVSGSKVDGGWLS